MRRMIATNIKALKVEKNVVALTCQTSFRDCHSQDSGEYVCLFIALRESGTLAIVLLARQHNTQDYYDGMRMPAPTARAPEVR